MRRRCRLLLLLAIALCVFPAVSYAKIGRLESHMTFSSQYSTYNDLQLGGGEKALLDSSIDGEIAFKVFRSFYLSMVGTKATDDSREGFGLGARIDLPGIFFIGASRGTFLLRAKQFPVNTSAYVQSMIVTNLQANGSKKRSVASKYGFTAEIFIFNNVSYLILDASLFTLEANTYVTYGFGLGLEF